MATQQWGRNESIIFPPHSPIYSYGAVFLAFILTGCFFYARFDLGQTPLQQFYTPIYARAAAGGALKKKNKFQLLYVGNGVAAGQLAVEADVQAGTTPALAGKHIPLALSRAVAARGLRALYRGPEQVCVDAPLTQYLKSAVFEDESLWEIYKLPFLFGFLSLLIQLASIDPAANRIAVAKDDGKQVTYDPERLSGITAYREISRDFSQGDRIQFTSTNRELGVSNRDLGAIQRIEGTQIDVKMDGEKERTVSFDSAKMRHFDHGYAVTSHSSQGLTTDRVLVNMDTTVHPELINTRFAYVSISRASQDARIYTNDAGHLGERLSTDVTKTSAIDLQKAPVEQTANQQSKEPPMTNSREHPQDDLRREPPTETMVSLPEIIRHEAEVDARHYAPIEAALPKETEGYEWKRETGDIESYKHDQTGGWLHIDPQSNFYDREAQPISRENALEHAAHEPSHSVAENAVVTSNNSDSNNEQGIGM
jgi:hypothetical protein